MKYSNDLGNILAKIFEPSNGGIGSKLKTAKITEYKAMLSSKL